MHQPGPVETVGNVDGMGWLPINFTSISGGSPISNLPVDPTNFINGGSQNVGQANLHYHYACRYPSFGFELMVLMESNQYKTIDNKAENDGGDDSMSYEVGTDLRILPANSFFTI
jgi:hypothetical protein